LKLAPAFYLRDLERLRTQLETANLEHYGADGFTLVGRRELRGNNSWMHQVTRLNRDQPRCTLLMNPDDASRLTLEDGVTVRLESNVGVIEVPLEVSADLARGVVSLPHGYGHTRDGIGWDVPVDARGSSYNDLVNHVSVDASGNAALSGVQVRISRG
jgi:anaerobic selenocysteine-containing dehydrogenase